MLPPITGPKRHLPQLKLPVPNSHSHFLSKYGLSQNTSSLMTPPKEVIPQPPTSLQPKGPTGRPRCKKCGKRLGLAEQYKCRYAYLFRAKCGSTVCSLNSNLFGFLVINYDSYFEMGVRLRLKTPEHILPVYLIRVLSPKTKWVKLKQNEYPSTKRSSFYWYMAKSPKTL